MPTLRLTLRPVENVSHRIYTKSANKILLSTTMLQSSWSSVNMTLAQISSEPLHRRFQAAYHWAHFLWMWDMLCDQCQSILLQRWKGRHKYQLMKQSHHRGHCTWHQPEPWHRCAIAERPISHIQAYSLDKFLKKVPESFKVHFGVKVWNRTF